jgi:hypothetical protein
MKPTLKDLEKQANQYHANHWDNGGASEFDQSINSISHKKIDVFYETYGKCFIYKVNPWNNTDPIVTEYNPEDSLYNFCGDFITKEKDETLVNLITEHNTPKEKYSARICKESIDKIYKRLDELNGVYLTWV